MTVRAFLGVIIVAVLLGIIVLSVGLVNFRARQPIEKVYNGLQFPVSFTFSHDGRMFYNEKNSGHVRMILSNGTLLQIPFVTLGPLPPGVEGTEQGLLGITLDPDFDTDHYVYVYWTYWNETNKHGIISRFTDVRNVGQNRLDIFDVTAPSHATNHNGGYLKFGPDRKLYVIIGEFADPPVAQDLGYNAGKILRMNTDGSVPNDNPFPNSLVWAYGIRNGFGMDFSPAGKLIATVAGPNCCDKLDFITKGGNYGWPTCVATCSPPYLNAIYQWDSQTVTPTGIAYSSDPDILYFGEYNTGNLMQLTLNSTGTKAKVTLVTAVGSSFNGILAVERAPDGRIYFSTTDSIYRFTPPI